MNKRQIGRRTFLKGTALVAFSGAFLTHSGEGRAQFAVPNSAGTEAPKLKLPPNACDCHHHIYDAARFPQPSEAKAPIIPNARVQEYRLLQKRLGTTRNIIVTPSAYAPDNQVTLDAIAQLGANARGVAVVRFDITDAQLKALDAGGIRGVRFAINKGAISQATLDGIEQLAGRLAAIGWHIQFQTTADQVAAMADLLYRLPTTLTFDHAAHVSPAGFSHPAYGVVRRLLDKGKTWVKLSVTYDNTKDGPPGFADLTTVAQAFVKAAPERMVWGSNWPHPNEINKPDDAVMLDLLAQWAPDEKVRHRILVENPGSLYGFEPAR